MFSETYTENMYLNTASNFIATLLGCIAGIVHSKLPTIPDPYNTLSIFFNPDTYEFLFHTAAGGAIAFFVKVTGDLTIHWFKNRKSKGGKHE